jgi:hypothetical protein
MGLRYQQVMALRERFSDLPPEVVVKEDLLRTGIAFSEDALRIAAGFKPKAYFIFSFDLVPITEMRRGENFRVPEEIALEGGREGFRRVIVSVRVNPASPYEVTLSADGRLILTLEGVEVCGVVYPEVPEYYRRTLVSGKPLLDIAPTIEWGYLIYLTVFRLCQYHGLQEECQFCDINANYRQQRKSGRSYTGVKSPEEIVEALEILAEHDSGAGAYTVTGGSITSELMGMSEADFYARYPEAIESRFPGRWISKLVVQALPLSDVRRFREAGVRIYHPNYEIWDPHLFEVICPGKQRYIGRDRWIGRILDAAGVFGPSCVIPNFVAGIEMARPHGFVDPVRAVASTAEGLDFFMSHGIVPRFTTWCPEPLTVLGSANREGAPLEYHVRLLVTWRDLLEHHGLPAPPGYGQSGVGRAVFSVSSFMDVVRSDRIPPTVLEPASQTAV